MDAGAAAKARIPTRVVPALNMFICECPGLLDEESGALICFHSWLPATLEDPADSEAVHTETARFALVLPESKPYYSSGGGNILDSP